jgi:hypothetical protein
MESDMMASVLFKSEYSNSLPSTGVTFLKTTLVAKLLLAKPLLYGKLRVRKTWLLLTLSKLEVLTILVRKPGGNKLLGSPRHE